METPEKITTAFMLNNDTKQVTESFRKVYRLAEKHQQEMPPWNWHACKMDMSQIDHLLIALKTVRKKVMIAFKATLQDKSPKQREEYILELNRALYCPEDLL